MCSDEHSFARKESGGRDHNAVSRPASTTLSSRPTRDTDTAIAPQATSAACLSLIERAAAGGISLPADRAEILALALEEFEPFLSAIRELDIGETIPFGAWSETATQRRTCRH